MPPQGAPAAEREHTLELSAVSKSYGQTMAVREVDLSVRRGEFVTLLGPSGSGKTTILRLVAGFIEPSAGQIFLDGRDVSSLPSRERGIGIVLQQYALFPHLNVAANVAYGLKMRGWDKADRMRKVREMLELVGLADLERRLPRQLSGGQQQRVALARALAFSPTLLLMDEPLGALDRELRVRMIAELRRIHAETGATVLYVTHDRDEALGMSDRIALMHDGVIDAVDTPQNLYRTPPSAFVAGFFGGHNLIPVTVTGDKDAGDGASRATVQCLGQSLSVRCAGELGNGAALLAVPAESMRVADGERAGLTIEAQVELLVFLGDTIELTFRADGEVYRARLPGGSDCPSERGASVRLVADPQALVAVPAA